MPSPGITPAYAGKSEMLFTVPIHLQDHPRVCGEKQTFAYALNGRLGSPPRMRGKDGSRPTLVKVEGITPAYAGKRAFHHG